MTTPALPETDPTPRSPAMAAVVYVLYLAAVMLGIPALIGLVLAYIARRTDGHWLESHYRFQIRTFWIGLGLGALVWIVTVTVGWIPLIGWAVAGLLGLAATAWFLLRSVAGLLRLGRRIPIANPTSWLLG